MFIVLQTNLELANGFVDRFDRFHAMASKIMGSMFQVLFGITQGSQGSPNLRMLFRRRRCRGCRSGGSRFCRSFAAGSQRGRTQRQRQRKGWNDRQEFLDDVLAVLS